MRESKIISPLDGATISSECFSILVNAERKKLRCFENYLSKADSLFYIFDFKFPNDLLLTPLSYHFSTTMTHECYLTTNFGCVRGQA